MTPTCPHGMPTPLSCWECMEDGNLPVPPPPAPVVADGPVMDAVYDGFCEGCHLAIHVGQRIGRMTDATWRHAHCTGPL